MPAGHRRPLHTRLALAAITIEVAATVLWLPPRAVRFLVCSWAARMAVSGASMEPALRGGDWLLVDPSAYRRRPPAAGDLVVVTDPRRPDRLLVKRVAAIDPHGRLDLRGDAPAASTDSRSFGTVEADLVQGRPWLRYWPPGRFGLAR